MNKMLLTSKMILPKSPPNLIERQHVNQLLLENTYKRLIIFRAPAGYGKTTQLSSWLQKKEEAVAWLSLDTADNDPISFWSYIVTSIDKVAPSLDNEQLLTLLHTQNQAGLEFFLHALIEELTALEQPIHLVLDDYHFVEQQMIHHLLIKLIEYLPENVRIYMTTRMYLSFPLAKWRVKQWVYEIEFEQLKFNRQETQQFFLEVAKRQLSEEQLNNVLANTEGWVSGLLLTTLANEKGNLYNEQASISFISEFLWNEIILKQPDDIQLFLLKTSLLQDLDPSLCNDLTGRADSEYILQQLEQQGLFIIKLHSVEPVYRYHHLLIEALQTELYKRFEKETVIEFVHKAATLHYNNGNYLLAIELAFKNNLYDTVAAWLDTYFVEIISSGHTISYLHWLELLIRAKYPCNNEILIMGFIQAISALKFKFAQELMDTLEIRQKTDRWMDDPQNTSLTILYIRTKAYFLVGLGDRLTEVIELLNSQFDMEYTENRWNKISIYYHNYEINMLRTSLASRGKLITIEEVPKVIYLFRHTVLSSLDVAPHIFSIGAAMFYEHSMFEEAEKEIEEVIQCGLELDSQGLYVPMYILKAKIFIQKKQLITAQTMLQQLLKSISDKHWKKAIQTMLARCHLLMGEIKNAQFLLDPTKSYQSFEQLTYARLLLCSERYEEALSLIIEIKMIEKQESQIATSIEATVLEIICHEQMKNHELALNTFHNVLPLVAKYNYIRTLLDDVAILPVIQQYLENPTYTETWDTTLSDYLTLLKQHMKTSPLIKKTLPSLTPREKDILKLIIDGATNREIASDLYLTEGTVRVYISTLYQKLGVNSRVQAIKLWQQNKELLT